MGFKLIQLGKLGLAVKRKRRARQSRTGPVACPMKLTPIPTQDEDLPNQLRHTSLLTQAHPPLHLRQVGWAERIGWDGVCVTVSSERENLM
ncbi:unnamed protein product [Prunus armeniaca]|uniref:Uncharacterized protein n=1 Tax=Prunus armeniaca TaxID=36596 RepID=A0A6J5TK88_PRUAR|nr:unnamed protein product [Prunus armeniaca]